MSAPVPLYCSVFPLESVGLHGKHFLYRVFLQQAAQQSVADTELAFSLLISSLEKAFSEWTVRIREQEEIDGHHAADLQQQLELEIATLMGQEEVLDKLLQTEDNIYFLQVCLGRRVCESGLLTR